MKTKKLGRNSLYLLLGGIADLKQERIEMLSREMMLDGGGPKKTNQEPPSDPREN